MQQYVIQLINLGYCEIAFHQNNALKFSELAKNVLFDGEKVRLTKVIDKPLLKKESKKTTPSGKSKTDLFERLRVLRLKISKTQGIPAYLVFNDASLKQMEKERPMTDEEFLSIDGVGRKKFKDYGFEFIKEIIAFQNEKTRTTKKAKKSKGNTYLETFKLYKKGHTAEEISQERKLNLTTIQSHYIKLFQDGNDIALDEFVTKKELGLISEAKVALNNTKTLRDYFDYFEEQMPYNSIKFGLAILEREDA